MDLWRLVMRSATYFWRTNLAIVLGVATAVAVLAGALLVGHSVRASLADLVQRRLGGTDAVVASPLFFRERLADDLATHPDFPSLFRAAAPLIVADGVVTDQETGRRATGVKVYGVDERFWQFHGLPPVPLGEREVAISAALAREVGASIDRALLVRVQRPSDIPLESLHGRKDDVGRTLRLTAKEVLDAASLGEFSLDAQQGDVLAAFVPLDRLQLELDVANRVNTILLAGAMPDDSAAARADALLQSTVWPEDIGLTIRASDDGRELVVGSVAGLLDDRQATAIRELPLGSTARTEVFTYLANTLQVGGREVPYSLVAGVDLSSIAPDAMQEAPVSGTPMLLNTWAARELSAAVGDRVATSFYIWEEPGQLATRHAEFIVAGIVPVEAGSRDLAPAYPGISDATNLRDWDPPFPLDLRRVRPVDEAYWEQYRTTPKAFVPIAVAKQLWGSRYGSVTSIRLRPTSGEDVDGLRSQLTSGLHTSATPSTFGLALRDVRSQNLAASRGATDFGEYFVYFSFFLVVSALVLVVLFFRLGIEQRVREVGLLRAIGLGPTSIRRLFVIEGAILALLGSLLGMAGAVGYAAALMTALTTRWVDAVGTTELHLHVSPLLLVAGGTAGIVAAVACIWWTLRSLRHISERSLLAGDLTAAAAQAPPSRFAARTAAGLAIVGATMAMLSGVGLMPATIGFFGAGASLLIAALTGAGVILRRPARRQIGGHGWRPIAHLATRQAAHRPGRTVLTMAVLASATFILVTVDAFRRSGDIGADDRHGGTGGYELLVRTLLPIVHDPASDSGREELNLFSLDRTTVLEPLRVRPGDDASCLNLYQPTNPRIAAPRDEFLQQGRFAFSASLATTEEERNNPWLLLHREEPDGAIPVIADANSMAYVLHRAVGDDFVIDNGGTPVTLRFVAALQDSIFQSEVLMASAYFRSLFPDQAGYSMLLVDTAGQPREVADQLEQGLGDAEADAVDTGTYLASFHRVENTYLSTFQTLGGLGLLLGTVGLGTVLLRNVLERRRELALLAAVGYRRSHFVLMAAAETLLIVLGGLGIGAICAAIAIAPAAAERGARVPLSGGALLLLGSVFAVALLSSVAAMAAATRSPLLNALRSE
ncbi:MAG: FtsX-like permease family protein [Vicinamibacterales bacterium]